MVVCSQNFVVEQNQQLSVHGKSGPKAMLRMVERRASCLNSYLLTSQPRPDRREHSTRPRQEHRIVYESGLFSVGYRVLARDKDQKRRQECRRCRQECLRHGAH